MKSVNIFIALLFMVKISIAQSISSLEASLYRTVPLQIQQTASYKKLNPLQQDIAYLFGMIEEVYPNWQTKIKPKELVKYRAGLLQQFEMDTSKVHLDMVVEKVLSRLLDAHCSSNMPFLYDAALAVGKEFPINFLLVGKDLYIRNIDKSKDTAIIGSRILAINNRTMETVRTIVKEFEPVESMEGSLFRFISQHANSPYWLKQLNLADNMDSITLLAQHKNGKKFTVTLVTNATGKSKMYKITRKPMATSRNAKGFYFKIDKVNNLAFLQLNTMSDYEIIKDGIAQYVSPQLLPMALNYMKSQHERNGTLNFNSFILNAMDSIRSSGVQNIVLDLRYNGGGDMRIPKQFLYLVDLPKPIQEFKTIKKISPFYQYAMYDDFKLDSIAYSDKMKQPIPVNGSMLFIDSICSTEAYKDFFADIKKVGTPFYINPTIPKFKGSLYVLTAFGTGSAAMITATTIADNKIGTIVGLPTGNKPTNSTGSSNVKLPNSSIPFSFSYTVMQRPDATKDGDIYLKPDVLIWRTMEAINNGIDEHLEWVIKDIAKKTTSEGQ
jgi:Peptidase family S41